MTLEEYREHYSEESAVGWAAIDEALEKLYRGQEPVHYPAELPMRLGGKEPLEGVSIYTSKVQATHFHYISYGMSELFYNEDAVGKAFSRWGFEFTCRVRDNLNSATPPTWIIALMNHLGRYVYKSQRWFEENHIIPVKPFGIITQDLEAIVFAKDSELGTIETPHGEVSFLQMVGINTETFKKLPENPTTGDVEVLLGKIKKENPLLLMDTDNALATMFPVPAKTSLEIGNIDDPEEQPTPPAEPKTAPKTGRYRAIFPADHPQYEALKADPLAYRTYKEGEHFSSAGLEEYDAEKIEWALVE